MSTFGVIVLAAGQGKRMKSSLPKVLHRMAGLPMAGHILRSIGLHAPGTPVCVVVGHGREEVEKVLRQLPEARSLKLSFVLQAEQRGTGHAARCAMDSEWGAEQMAAKHPILVLPGDLPLISADLVEGMVAPLGRTDAMRLLTCELPDPSGYGRIVRRGRAGPVLRIVEERDANVREKAIREVGASIYFFQGGFLKAGLGKLSNKNSQGEYYLTDLVSQAVRAKKKVDVLLWKDPAEVRGVNDPWELAEAARLMNRRIVRGWALSGVRVTDPESTWIDVQATLAPGCALHPRVQLHGLTELAANVTVEAGCVLTQTQVAEGARIKVGTVAEDAKIGPGANVGPYAHLRPGSELGASVKVGNFVELKKSRIGDSSSVAHLSYLGDAEVGRNVNIGCGFVTCNFDGRVINGERKHKTIIEDDVFMGSDCQTVAPVKIGKGAFVASGSTITEDVEPDALALARAKQVNKPGYAKKLRAQMS